MISTAYWRGTQTCASTSYVDDHTLTAVGDTEDEVVDKLEAAAVDLHRVVTTGLKCDISWDKAASASSSRSLAMKVRRRLGKWAGKDTNNLVCNLGADFRAGNKRGRTRKRPSEVIA